MASLPLGIDFPREQIILSSERLFSGLVGILSVVAQTGVLLLLTQAVGTKHTITLGLCFQCAQLTW